MKPKYMGSCDTGEKKVIFADCEQKRNAKNVWHTVDIWAP